MNGLVTLIIAIVISLGAGFAIARFMFKGNLDKEKNDLDRNSKELENRYQDMMKEAKDKAETARKNKILEAREKIIQMKDEHEQEVSRRNKHLASLEGRLKQKEQILSKKIEDASRKETDAQKQIEDLERMKKGLEVRMEEIGKMHRNQVEQLEKMAGMSGEDAKNQLFESMKEEARTKAKSFIKEITDEARLTATKEARKIVVETLQRVSTEQTIENCISVFHIDNDEMKGRIIGREGRNIRALEAATGIEIIVDDTPEAIILSGFDPVRREIARLALHRLVTDGRIHPARIEEVVGKTRKQIEEEIIEIGERTCIDLGIHGLHPELIRHVGRMRYRSSYGQNLLQHSREVANFCSIMAAELGLNTKLAKRAGLLHDIGKVSEEDPELPHALLGAMIAERFNENPVVINAIGAHHDEMEMTSPLSAIVQVCDAISGARPGARREVFESYIKRLKDLEAIALSYDGVQKSYAIQAGRELRVIVESEKVPDNQADMLAFDISQRIQNELTYPGQIKVTVIRERRAVSYAK